MSRRDEFANAAAAAARPATAGATRSAMAVPNVPAIASAAASGAATTAAAPAQPVNNLLFFPAAHAAVPAVSPLTLVVVVLGNGSPAVYSTRVRRGVQLFRELAPAYQSARFLCKTYTNRHMWPRAMLAHSLGVDHSNETAFWRDDVACYYLDHQLTKNTELEAIGVRYCLQLLRDAAAAAHQPLPRFELRVVTSECHALRTRYIFEAAFEDVRAWAVWPQPPADGAASSAAAGTAAASAATPFMPVIPSVTTRHEQHAQNRAAAEKGLLANFRARHPHGGASMRALYSAALIANQPRPQCYFYHFVGGDGGAGEHRLVFTNLGAYVPNPLDFDVCPRAEVERVRARLAATAAAAPPGSIAVPRLMTLVYHWRGAWRRRFFGTEAAAFAYMFERAHLRPLDAGAHQVSTIEHEVENT